MMTDDLNNLERELDRELGRWSGWLDVRPEGPCVESVRTAVRCELGDLWLGAYPSPAPDPAAIERVRAAVATELRTGPERKRQTTDIGLRAGIPASGLRHWISTQGWASLGAAAMLLLCVGVIWYASALGRPATWGESELFAAAIPGSPIDPIRTEVQSLETELPEDEAFPHEDGESLGEVVQEMDQLLGGRDPAKGTSRVDGEAAGVLG